MEEKECDFEMKEVKKSGAEAEMRKAELRIRKSRRNSIRKRRGEEEEEECSG